MSWAEQRAHATAFRGVLLKHLEDGPTTATQLAAVTGVRSQMIRDYMHRLIKEGHVKSCLTSGPRPQGGNSVMALYSLVSDETPQPAKPEKQRKYLPGDVPQRSTSSHYPANEVRDPYALPSEFFASSSQQTMRQTDAQGR